MGELLDFTILVEMSARSRLQDKIPIRTCSDEKVMLIARILNSLVVFRFP